MRLCLKVLESANIKLASVATDVLGVSGRAMWEALMVGQVSPAEMAELAKGRLCDKREPLAKALEGRVQARHRCVLTELLCQIDNLDETIARFDAQMEADCAPYKEAVGLLDTIPGVARQTADIMVAEIGTDMRRLPTADQLAAWAGVAPGNQASAGQRRSGRTRKATKPLGVVLNQMAHGRRAHNPYVFVCPVPSPGRASGQEESPRGGRPFDCGHRVSLPAVEQAVPRMRR